MGSSSKLLLKACPFVCFVGAAIVLIPSLQLTRPAHSLLPIPGLTGYRNKDAYDAHGPEAHDTVCDKLHTMFCGWMLKLCERLDIVKSSGCKLVA